jgi:hypothetical protein
MASFLNEQSSNAFLQPIGLARPEVITVTIWLTKAALFPLFQMESLLCCRKNVTKFSILQTSLRYGTIYSTIYSTFSTSGVLSSKYRILSQIRTVLRVNGHLGPSTLRGSLVGRIAPTTYVSGGVSLCHHLDGGTILLPES